MAAQQDRILIVESDPMISDLIGRQTLMAAGYQVNTVSDAASAIPQTLQWAPDVIITNLALPGLSGKDLLVALRAQNSTIPVIILSPRGMETDIIQSFRLGAADFLLWPAREAEVLSAVERVLKQVHERRDREQLSVQLQQTNQELQSRVRELTTVFALGKTLTSTTDQNTLLQKVLQSTSRVFPVDLGWVLLREDEKHPFLLSAHLNLPPSILERLNQPWDDGISSLVAMSGEALCLNGGPLKQFKITNLGEAAIIQPIKIQKQVIGLITLMRKKNNPFTTSQQHLLEALADYASISLVNTRLFKAVEDRARSLQTVVESTQMRESIQSDLLINVKNELSHSALSAQQAMERLAKDPTSHWRSDQRQLLSGILEQLHTLQELGNGIPPHGLAVATPPVRFDLLNVAKASIQQFSVPIQQAGLRLIVDPISVALPVIAEPEMLILVIHSMLGYALRYCNEGGTIRVHLEKLEQQALLSVSHSGHGLNASAATQLLKTGSGGDDHPPLRFSGLGIRLPVAQQILSRIQGKMTAESKTSKGVTLTFTLPLAQG